MELGPGLGAFVHALNRAPRMPFKMLDCTVGLTPGGLDRHGTRRPAKVVTNKPGEDESIPFNVTNGTPERTAILLPLYCAVMGEIPQLDKLTELLSRCGKTELCEKATP